MRRAPAGLAAGLAAVAFLLRAVMAIAWPTIHRPDETFQNLEPAYRLLTGWGVVSWEWREGIRSFLFPDLLAGAMAAGRLVHAPPIASVAVALALVASAFVVVAVAVGWHRGGMAGALLCGVLAAGWPDLVYFGPKPLLEVQGGTLLALAAGLASLPRSRGRLVWIGLLLGAAFDLRLQLAPALAVVAVGAAWRDGRAWVALLAGAALPVVLLGVVDAATWGSPFQSVWKNVQINFFQDRASIYGVEPVYWYGLEIVRRYGVAAIALAACFGLGVRAAPLLATVAAVVVLSHSLIAHKELSFIYGALPCALVVAGLGAARWLGAASPRRLALGGAAAVVVMAAACWAARPFREAAATAQLRTIWAALRQAPNLCGVALYDPVRFPWVYTPGYVGLERPVPIGLLANPEALVAASGFNYLVAEIPSLPAGERVLCTANFCLLRRDQSCTPTPAFEINAVLRRLGQ